jgi:hypothetical protein
MATNSDPPDYQILAGIGCSDGNEKSEFVNRTEWVLLFPEESGSDPEEITVSVRVAGREVAECTLKWRALFDALSTDGTSDVHQIARCVSRIAGKVLFENALGAWLDDQVWNESLDQKGVDTTSDLCALLSDPSRGSYEALRLDEVQWHLKHRTFTSAAVTQVVKAIERGLRAKVLYFQGKRGRRRANVDESLLEQARSIVAKVQPAAAQAKLQPSFNKKRVALQQVLSTHLPNTSGKELSGLASELVSMEPKEIALRVAKRCTGVSIKKIEGQLPTGNSRYEFSVTIGKEI